LPLKNGRWRLAFALAVAVLVDARMAHAVPVPEMDPGLAGAGLTLLAASLLMVFGRRARR